jgi:hypothetical protein
MWGLGDSAWTEIGSTLPKDEAATGGLPIWKKEEGRRAKRFTCARGRSLALAASGMKSILCFPIVVRRTDSS